MRNLRHFTKRRIIPKRRVRRIRKYESNVGPDIGAW